MATQKKQPLFSIEDGTAFFSNEVTVNFNPNNFVLDFKSITPRFDPRSTESPVIKLEHNVVVLEPEQFKSLLKIMSKAIEDFEKKVREVKVPEKKEALKTPESNLSSDAMSYYG